MKRIVLLMQRILHGWRYLYNYFNDDWTRCYLCGEKYVGLAQDCACTNWGKVTV